MIAAPGADANPGGCTDGNPAGTVGTRVTPWGPTDGPAYVGAEVFVPPYHGAGVCYVLPAGLGGGIFFSWTTVSQDAAGDRTSNTIVRCENMGTGTVRPACALNVTADTNDDANADTVGKTTTVSISGSVGSVTLNGTGAHVEPDTDTNTEP